MEYNGEGIHALVCALEDLQNSNLIFVDKKLRSVLKCLAYYEEFRTVLAYCNKGFDYQAEKRKALTKLGENDILRLPKAQKTLVALVSNMLVEFDTGEMDIVIFAHKYFPSETKQHSFDQCFIKLIEPFKLALVSLVVEGIDEEPQAVARTVEFVSSALQQQTEYLLVNMVNSVRAATIDETERKDLTLMLEGFAAALDSRDSLMIRAIWEGLKRALKQEELCRNEIEKTDEVLRMYLVS